MGRVHLFEFGDMPWLPRALHQYLTDYLGFVQVHMKEPARRFAPLVARLLASAGDGEDSRCVVDLCSGGAGPWPALLEALDDLGGDDAGPPARVTLTDLSPNEPALARAADRSGGRISYRADSIDATAVPADLSGPRTIFNGFHHLPPDLARSVLADAAAARRPIGVFELVARTPTHLLTSPLTIVGVAVTTPFIRPLRWGRFAWTYPIPIVPLLVLFDGVVSMLRVYSARELERMVADIDAPDYAWEIGHVRVGPTRMPYLLGLPTSR